MRVAVCLLAIGNAPRELLLCNLTTKPCHPGVATFSLGGGSTQLYVLSPTCQPARAIPRPALPQQLLMADEWDLCKVWVGSSNPLTHPPQLLDEAAAQARAVGLSAHLAP